MTTNFRYQSLYNTHLIRKNDKIISVNLINTCVLHKDIRVLTLI